jgi:alpha-amylase/alpha-mannosidase (GH57 family)
VKEQKVATEDRLPIAFLWHMHQPLYKDLVTGTYQMPWVRLHATKDYYSMVTMLERFPSVHVTFNLVPSLLVQLEDYASSNATDAFLEVSRKDAELLEPEEKEFVLYNFFMANWETMVKAFPRYNDLLEKRGLHFAPARAKEVASTFTTADFRDLQFLFNLVWINSSIRRSDKALKRLTAKGANYTEDDKALVLEKQAEIVASVVPKYKDALSRGQIEITTTAFYHPILPLLYDTLLAEEARPGTPMPKVRMRYPEDVEVQIERAVSHHKTVFGQQPLGMWPAEGAVCEQIIPAMARHGIKWTASGEEVLAASLGAAKIPEFSARRENPPAFLYRPYRVDTEGASAAMVFRDRVLSDLIAFTYHRWPAEKAVDDLVDRLNRIRLVMATEDKPHLVSIIMDGENAWERYPDDGQPFLNLLYERLSSDRGFSLVSIGQFLEQNAPTRSLPRLSPGSWIKGDFDVWIGGEEENLAWDYLDDARTALARREQRAGRSVPEANFQQAWEEIYVSEGSDWNWWYGEHHSSANDAEFDELYRKRLRNVYQLIGLEPPQELFRPIITRKVRPAAKPVALMTPTIDGTDTNYYEWLPAGMFDVKVAGGTMHGAESIISRIYFGFDLENLYLRIDDGGSLVHELEQGTRLKLLFLTPEDKEVVVEQLKGDTGAIAVLRDVKQAGSVSDVHALAFAIGSILEMGVRFADLGVRAGTQIRFFVILERGGLEIERCPNRGPVSIDVPTEEFGLVNWYV